MRTRGGGRREERGALGCVGPQDHDARGKPKAGNTGRGSGKTCRGFPQLLRRSLEILETSCVARRDVNPAVAPTPCTQADTGRPGSCRIRAFGLAGRQAVSGIRHQASGISEVPEPTPGPTKPHWTLGLLASPLPNNNKHSGTQSVEESSSVT